MSPRDAGRRAEPKPHAPLKRKCGEVFLSASEELRAGLSRGLHGTGLAPWPCSVTERGGLYSICSHLSRCIEAPTAISRKPHRSGPPRTAEAALRWMFPVNHGTAEIGP